MPQFSPYAPEILFKTVNETEIFSLSFAKRKQIVDGQTLASVTSVTADESGLTLGSGSVNADGDGVTFSIAGGTLADADTEAVYHIHVIAVTSGGEILEGAGILYLIR